MLMHFLICLFVGVLITIGLLIVNVFQHRELFGKKVYVRTQITPQELMISTGANFLVAVFSVLMFQGYLMVSVHDKEVLNGYVVDKRRVKVSCDHFHDCRCKTVRRCTGTGDSRTCRKVEECDRCPDHSYDVDWPVNTTVGSFLISRENRQGTVQPDRWTAVKVGEPASSESYYENFLLATDDKYFVFDFPELLERYKGRLLSYPSTYDYYRFNRVLNSTTVNTVWLNSKLGEWLADNGAAKQLNLIYVFTYEPREYFDATMAHWKGGKKNDLIIFFGMDADAKKIAWIEANTYAKGMNNRNLIEKLKNDIGEAFSESLVDKQLQTIATDFNRLPAEQFAERKNQISVPFWFTLIVLIINIGASVGVHIFMRKQ